MKRPLLMVAFLALACAALAPMTSTPPMLLSADGADWKCSTSALILTTCAPRHDVHLTSMN